MPSRAKRTAARSLAVLAISIVFAAVARGQDMVVVACTQGSRCTYQRAYSPALNGQNSVRLAPFPTGGDVSRLPAGRSGRLNGLPGLYREPGSDLLRILSPSGELSDVVMPSKPLRAATPGSAAASSWILEYRDQPKSKTRVAVPPDQFVALIRDPRPVLAVVQFLKREVQAPRAHPMQQQLIAGAVVFAEGSQELQMWREELRSTMRRSLDAFQTEAVDPTRMETILAEGVSAIRVHRLVASDAHQDEALQQNLNTEYQRLLERFAVAGALKNAGMDDAFLEKLNQIGLARWSRPDLVAQVDEAIRASAELHHHRATELFNSGQYGGAFDEARLASSRARCNDDMNALYYRARVEFVNRNAIAALPEYVKENRSFLQQIVRELQSGGDGSALTQEGSEYVRKRIAEGERLDKDYLPLQFKKAEFLEYAGELTTSRDVVTNIERTVVLGRTDAEQWLGMDASLNSKLVTTRQSVDRRLKEQIGSGQFKEALATAASGLKAEPTNPQFLYYGAVAAAVLRDEQQSRRLAQRYLRLAVPACGLEASARETLLDLYRRQPADAGPAQTAGKIPNWISGELYAPGEVFYDPMSGSFNSRVLSSVLTTGKNTTGTEFRWEGFLVSSIQTSEGLVTGSRRTTLELEPVYDSKRVYMGGIATRANSAGQRRIMPLRYLNSPEFDPMLASKFTGTVSTRGWAGNPFFHPFAWNDIFLFDLKYDERGRIKEAIPVPPDATRPMSQYSERLTFTWEANSDRLRAIAGTRYRREMAYDKHGRLVAEKITHPSGKGKIEYTYRGDSLELIGVRCEDNFYDKGKRVVYLQPPIER